MGMEERGKWLAVCEAMAECKISVILEAARDSIDGGVIVTDIDDVLDHIGYSAAIRQAAQGGDQEANFRPKTAPNAHDNNTLDKGTAWDQAAQGTCKENLQVAAQTVEVCEWERNADIHRRF